MIDESILAKVSNLSPADRLELIGMVWDTLSADDLPVTDAERALLDARLLEMESNPDGRNGVRTICVSRWIYHSTRRLTDGSTCSRRWF
jgi:putative addiction module component (TIGR02574 family)